AAKLYRTHSILGRGVGARGKLESHSLRREDLDEEIEGLSDENGVGPYSIAHLHLQLLRSRRRCRLRSLQKHHQQADEAHRRRALVSRARKNRSSGSTIPPSVRTATSSIASRRRRCLRSSLS